MAHGRIPPDFRGFNRKARNTVFNRLGKGLFEVSYADFTDFRGGGYCGGDVASVEFAKNALLRGCEMFADFIDWICLDERRFRVAAIVTAVVFSLIGAAG